MARKLIAQTYDTMKVSTPEMTVNTWAKVLRISIGLIYLWFGALKFFPGVSPAEDLAKDTIYLLTFRLLDPGLSLLLLAVWETVAGAMLIAGIYTRLASKIVLVHMLFTFTPLFLLPAQSFTSAPFSLTLVGQYIIKNIVIVCAICLMASHERTREQTHQPL